MSTFQPVTKSMTLNIDERRRASRAVSASTYHCAAGRAERNRSSPSGATCTTTSMSCVVRGSPWNVLANEPTIMCCAPASSSADTSRASVSPAALIPRRSAPRRAPRDRLRRPVRELGGAHEPPTSRAAADVRRRRRSHAHRPTSRQPPERALAGPSAPKLPAARSALRSWCRMRSQAPDYRALTTHWDPIRIAARRRQVSSHNARIGTAYRSSPKPTLVSPS